MKTVFIEPEDCVEIGAHWIDCRFSLTDCEAGYKLYQEGHVEGAVYWDLNEDLSDLSKKGRHPLPDHLDLLALFEESGLRREDTIYLYDAGGEPYAARAWWTLQYGGFEKSYIVQGGFAALQKEGMLITNHIPQIEPSEVSSHWQDHTLATYEEVLKATKSSRVQLIDARSNSRYRGEWEPIDSIAGHIPSAINQDWERFVKGDRFVLDTPELHAFIEQAQQEEQVIVYCGSGVTAAPLYALLRHYGMHDSRLYVGSYSEWITYNPTVIERK